MFVLCCFCIVHFDLIVPSGAWVSRMYLLYNFQRNWQFLARTVVLEIKKLNLLFVKQGKVDGASSLPDLNETKSFIIS